MTQLTEVLRRSRMHLAIVVANAAFAAIFVTVALSGFHRPVPHDLPVGIVGSPAAVQAVRGGLNARVRGGFDLRTLASASRARAELEDRRIDAALLVGPSGFELLTAAAGGTAPAQAITTAVTAAAVAAARPLTVTDVVPPRPQDSQALSSFFLLLCVLFPSLATGIAAGHSLRRSPLPARLAVLVGVAAAAGLGVAAIGDGISGLGHYWALAGIVALFSLAISAPAAALGQIRPHLVALAVLVFLIVGIPVSGGPANLGGFGPGFLRSLGSALPLGDAVAAARNTVYFHAAATTGRLWVLAAFAAGGLTVLATLPRVAPALHRH